MKNQNALLTNALSIYLSLFVSAVSSFLPGHVSGGAIDSSPANGVELSKQWEREFGGSGDDVLTALQATPDGGAILGGHSFSGVTGNKETPNYGGADYWVIKVDARGEKQWERSFGGAADDFLRAVVRTADGGYILVGYSASGISGNKTTASFGGVDVWLIKLDAGGNKIWEREYGGSGGDSVDTSECMIQTSDGGFLLAASSTSTVSGNKTLPNVGAAGGLDWWILKLNSEGQKIWEKVYGSSWFDEPYTVRELVGGYLIAGTANADGGNKTTSGFGHNDGWIIKTDLNGDRVAEYCYGSWYSDSLIASLLLPDGGFWLGGAAQRVFAQPLSDFWLVRVDASGNKVVDRRYGGAAHAYCYGILPMVDGTYLATGSSSANAQGDKALPSFGGMDWWFFSFDGNGVKLQEWALGGAGEDVLLSAATVADGSYLLGGLTASGATGNKTLPNFGGNDWWLVKIRVQDSTPPTVSCPPALTAAADGTCQAAVPDILGSVSASDDYTPPEALSKIQTPPAGTMVGCGVHTILVTVTDAAGNSASCSTTFAVADTTPPTISCPADITKNNDPDACGAVVTYTAPVGTDNCPGAMMVQTAGLASGSLFPVGTTVNTFEVADAAGNKTSCSFRVTISDTQPPAITGCPGDITVYTGPGRTSCDQVAMWTPPTASDNCPGATITSSHASGNVFPVGTTKVTYTARDAAGNTTKCDFNVTVVDDTPPVIAGCPGDITMKTSAGDPTKCEQVVVWTPPTASDNCAVANFTSAKNPGDVFPVGTTPVTYTAKDRAGNATVCSFHVSVVDDTPPTITSVAASPNLLWPSNHKMVPVRLAVSATDICGSTVSKILSVNCNEPAIAPGSGQTSPDWQITGNLTINLRAERSGPGNSRIYTIIVQCKDVAGNTSTATVAVTVPHDQGK